MSSISSVFGYLLNWLYELCGNYGLAIIIFSVILKLILIPLTIKQQKAMKESAELQDKMKEIQNKYKNDTDRLNRETMELYKSRTGNPFSGCLISILQIIIILSVFWLVSRPLTYMKKVDKEIIDSYTEQIKEETGEKNLSYSEIVIINKKAAENPEVYINMDFLGLDLSKVPSQNFNDPKVYIIPALYVLTSFASMKINNNMQNKDEKDKNEENKAKTEQDEALESMQEMTKSMSYMMPIMTISIAFIAPLGMALYWFISNLLMIIEKILIEKISKIKSKKEVKRITD